MLLVKMGAQWHALNAQLEAGSLYCIYKNAASQVLHGFLPKCFFSAVLLLCHVAWLPEGVQLRLMQATAPEDL
jgi:hypothetical protein